ncbi:autotransporter domain-containing protein [Alphaproteobacteria bacterium]|nr:autotransporter domain-containing protein [Alphaproteobacteria bacterium]
MRVLIKNISILLFFIRTISFVITLSITSQVMAQDQCVSGTSTVATDGCLIAVIDDVTFDLTGDISVSGGQSGIWLKSADRNTVNYTGNINNDNGSVGVYIDSSSLNNITINGDINAGANGLYGIVSAVGDGSNTITMNGDITTNKYVSYGYANIFQHGNNFTLNGNITTNGDDAPSILISGSNNVTITLNGNLNIQGETRLLNGRGIDISMASVVSTITNLGTITTAGDDPYDIYLRDASTLATLNNRQAGLTYYGKIPTNYNAVINSTSDYGKIIFSTVSGTTSFGIYAGSVLQNNTTYASVIDGLEASNITAGNSGNYTYDGRTWAWTLENPSANLWDLVVGACTGCILEDTQDTIEEIGDGIVLEFSQLAQLSDKATGSFANMNTYDCDLFGTEGKCYSMGGRHTDVNGQNNSDSSSSGAVFVTGYRFNDNFRASAFIDQQVSRKNPKGLRVHNKGPMVGANLVWNQFANHLGFQFRLANAYQAKDMTITRSALGEAEAGRGETEIEVQNYVAEVSYQFSDGVKTSYRPYFAARRSIIKQDGYTETGVVNPLTYNTLEDKSTTIVMGIKAKYKLNNTITLNGAYGVEHDVNNHVDKIQATSSTITGITPVDLNTTINKTRPVVTLGVTYYITPTQAFSAQVQHQELSYTSTNARTAYFNYTVGF